MKTLTKEEMDQVIVDHLVYESKDDLEGVLSTLTDDVEHEIMGLAWGTQHGKAGARMNYEYFYPRLQVESFREVRRLYGDDFVTFDMECDAIVDGEVCGLEPGPGRATFRAMHVFEFKDGLISLENVWADYQAMARTFTRV